MTKELEDSGSRISGPLKRGNKASVVDTYTVVGSANVAPLKGNPAYYKHYDKNRREKSHSTLLRTAWNSRSWCGTGGAGISVCIAAMEKEH